KWYGAQQAVALAQEGAPHVSLSTGNASSGQSVFSAKCTACHNAAPFAQMKVGPGLADLFDDPNHPNLVTGKQATPANVADIIEHGARGSLGVMPNMQINGLTDKDVVDLVAYLQTLHK